MKRKLLSSALSLAALVLVTAAPTLSQAVFDSNSYYRLTTEWQGTGKSLDVVNDGRRNDRLRLANTGNLTGQHWKFTSAGDGSYRLTTKWRGTEYSMDVSDDGKDQPVLYKSSRVTGQFWVITPFANGSYRITNLWKGKNRSLDIINDGTNNNQPVLAATGNTSGQRWKITKVN